MDWRCILVLIALEMCIHCLGTVEVLELAALSVNGRVMGPIKKCGTRRRGVCGVSDPFRKTAVGCFVGRSMINQFRSYFIGV